MSATQNEKEKHKPTVKEQTPQTYVQVERGIYRYKEKDGEVTIMNGPKSLENAPAALSVSDSPGRPISAMPELSFLVGASKSRPGETHMREAEPPKTENPKPTVSKIIQVYVGANYLDRYFKPRVGRTLECEIANCDTLLEYWNDQLWDTLTPQVLGRLPRVAHQKHKKGDAAETVRSIRSASHFPMHSISLLKSGQFI